MNLLLDSHVVLWALADIRLSDAGKALIEDPGNEVCVSAATVWELMIKKNLGKLDVDDDLLDQIAAADFAELPVTWAHAEGVGALPAIHRDPFDRVLVAQARHEGMTIVSADPEVARYGVPTIDPTSL